MSKKKPDLALLIRSRGDGEDGTDDQGGEPDKLAAAKDVMRALKSGDAEAFCEAMGAVIDLHMAEDDDDDDGNGADGERGEDSHDKGDF